MQEQAVDKKNEKERCGQGKRKKMNIKNQIKEENFGRKWEKFVEI